MGKSKKVQVPSIEIDAAQSTIDAICDKRIKSLSDSSEIDIVNQVREALKTKIDAIVVADDKVDAQQKKQEQEDRKLKRVREEIEATSARIAELRDCVPALANGIIGKENEVNVAVNLKGIAAPEVSDEKQAKAFQGMKETLNKLEENLADVGKEMPAKLESLQVRRCWLCVSCGGGIEKQ